MGVGYEGLLFEPFVRVGEWNGDNLGVARTEKVQLFLCRTREDLNGVPNLYLSGGSELESVGRMHWMTALELMKLITRRSNR